MKLLLNLLGYLMVLWIGATVNFLLPRLLPGDPVEFLVGEESSRLSPEQRDRILTQFELDRPLSQQYFSYLSSLLRLDLGSSVAQGRPVLEIVRQSAAWTLLLVGSAIGIAFLLGLFLACLFHYLSRSYQSSSLLGFVIFFGSLPPFWVGMVLIAVFAVAFGSLPSHGAIDPMAEGIARYSSILKHALLPITTLTISYLPAVFLLARASLEEALGSAYVALSRSHGAGPWRVLLRQATPNAVLPLVNQFAMAFGSLLGGTVVIESVFAYPGMGLALYQGIMARDFPLVQGVFLILVLTVVFANLVADLVQSLLGPRSTPAKGQTT